MTDVLILSNLISWALILALAITVLALARQIGVLHERIKPVGALSFAKVIKAGEAAPLFVLPSLNGGSITLGGNAQKSTLLFFLSPTCPVCKTLLPLLKSVQHSEQGWLQLVFASDGVESDHLNFIQQQQLDTIPYLLSREVGMAYQIGKLPYAVLISNDGLVSSHGLINNREHLESLFEANKLGYATVQDLNQAQKLDEVVS